MIHNVSIIKNQWTLIAQMGVWVTSILATGDLRIRANKIDGSVFETELVSGMTFDVKGGYQSISMTSSVTQTAKLWLSENKLNWSPQEARLVGATTVSSDVAKCFYGQPQELLPAQVGRKKVTIYAPEDIYIGGDGVSEKSAIKISAGTSRDIETQGRIFAFSKETKNALVSSTMLSPDAKPDIGLEINGAPTQLAYKMACVADGGPDSRLWLVNGQTKLMSVRLSDMTAFDSGISGVQAVAGIQNGGLVQMVRKDGANIELIEIGSDNVINTRVLHTMESSGGYIRAYGAFGDYIAFECGNNIYCGTKSGGVKKVASPIVPQSYVIAYMFCCPNGEIMVGYVDGSFGGLNFKSIDGGETWSDGQANPQNMPNNLGSFHQDLVNGDVFVMNNNSTYKSTNQGASWVSVFGNSVKSLIAVDGAYIFSELLGVTIGSGAGSYKVTWGKKTSGQSIYHELRAMTVAPDGALYGILGSKLTRIAGEFVKSGGLDVAVMTEVN